MNRHVGFYLLTPGLSIYMMCLLQLISMCTHKIKHTEITESMLILTNACLFIFLPIALVLIKTGNQYAPLFKTKKQFWCLLIPIFGLSGLALII